MSSAAETTPRLSPPRLRAMALVISALASSQVFAQATLVPPDADTSRLRPAPLPLPSVPNFDLRIETPEKSAVPKAVDDIEFDIRDIVVEGAAYYPTAVVNKIFQPLIGTRTRLDTLRAAADALEARYRADGFFLVRVFIPPQQVSNGIFQIRVIEGFIESVSAEGGNDAARALVEQMLAPVLNKKPIDLASLERALLVLNDMPGIRGSGVLRPGTSLGASELVVSMPDQSRYSVTAGVNNTASKTMGTIGTLLSVNINNPFESRPGSLSLGVNASGDLERLKAFNARYATALNADGLVMSVGGLLANARPGASLKSLDIESNSASLSPRLRYALTRSRGLSTFLEGGLSINYSRTTLLGSELTEDRSSVLDLAYAVTDNGRANGNTELSLGIAQGLPVLGANSSNTSRPSVKGFDSSFTKLRFNLNRLQNLPGQYSVQMLAQGQWTQDKLLAGEQVFFGGMGLGRAYDSGAVVGDKGAGAVLELRRDIFPGQWQGLKDGILQLYVFTDYAHATSIANPVAGTGRSSNRLHSLGAGFRYRDNNGWSFEMLLADARRTITSLDPRNDPRVLAILTKSF